jgi:putative SOS response-associated peptidase YedK
MPVILDPAVYDAWLDPATPASDAKSLLSHNLDGDLQFHGVDRAVNSTKDRSDSSDMVQPINPL